MNRLQFVALVCLNASLVDRLHADPIETDWGAVAAQLEEIDPERLAEIGEAASGALETMIKSDAERADFEQETESLADELGIDLENF